MKYKLTILIVLFLNMHYLSANTRLYLKAFLEGPYQNNQMVSKNQGYIDEVEVHVFQKSNKQLIEKISAWILSDGSITPKGNSSQNFIETTASVEFKIGVFHVSHLPLFSVNSFNPTSELNIDLSKPTNTVNPLIINGLAIAAAGNISDSIGDLNEINATDLFNFEVNKNTYTSKFDFNLDGFVDNKDKLLLTKNANKLLYSEL